MLWHAYVDESGDRGWVPRPPNLPPGQRAGSSAIFSMTAVIVPDGSQPAILRGWSQAAQEIDRASGVVVHWQNVKNTGQRKHLATYIASIPHVHTVSVVLCKGHLPNVQTLRQPEYLYNWTLRLLVERVSWFGNSHGDQVRLTFAEVPGLPLAKLTVYLAKLKANQTYIDWGALRLPPRIDTPKNRRMLQLADSASGAVFAAFEPDLWGYTEQGYLTILKPVIWRRPPEAVEGRLEVRPLA